MFLTIKKINVCPLKMLFNKPDAMRGSQSIFCSPAVPHVTKNDTDWV